MRKESNAVGQDQPMKSMSTKKRIGLLTKNVLQICSDNRISLSESSHSNLRTLKSKLTRFFCKKTKEGFERADRRFLLENDGRVKYQSDTRELSMPFHKLLASLSFSHAKLFHFVKATSVGSIRGYSNEERNLIRAFVHSSKIPLKTISSVKMRSICKM